MWANIDQYRQIKKKKLIPEKVTRGPILLLLQLSNSSLHRYANFQFSSFTCDYYSLFSLLTLAKTICLVFHLMSVNSNWTDAQESSQEKRNDGMTFPPPPPPPTWRWRPTKCAQRSLNKYKGARIGLNELKMSLNKPT